MASLASTVITTDRDARKQGRTHCPSLRALACLSSGIRSPHDVQFSLLMAASTLAVVPMILIVLAFQRSFIDGLTVGSIK